jgi:hypothetical protein
MLTEMTCGNFAIAPDALTVKGNGGDTADPPFAAVLRTVSTTVPAVAMSVAEICADIEVALWYVVVRAPPFQFTTESCTKLVPVRVSVKAAPPAVAFCGETEVIVGVSGGDGKIEKFKDDVVPPPEFATVIGCVPELATSAALIAAWTALALTNVVVRALPFHFTVAPDVKPAPFTVSVKSEAPATMLGGVSEQIAGDDVENTGKPTTGELITLPPPAYVNAPMLKHPAMTMSSDGT